MRARLLWDMLNREGLMGGRWPVFRMMEHMDLEPLYRCPRTSPKNPAHRISAYLLRGLTIENLLNGNTLGPVKN